jgi:hypothetical protein
LGTGSVEEFDGNISTSEAENESYVTDTTNLRMKGRSKDAMVTRSAFIERLAIASGSM